MAQIERYDFYADIGDGGGAYLDIFNNKHGDYVRYDEHEEVVDKLKNKIENLQQEIEELEGDLSYARNN